MERRLSQVMRGRGPASRSGFRKPFQKHMAGLLGEGKASSAGTQPRSSPAAAHLQERLTFPGLHPIRKGAWEMGKEGRRKSIKRVMKGPHGHGDMCPLWTRGANKKGGFGERTRPRKAEGAAGAAGSDGVLGAGAPQEDLKPPVQRDLLPPV